MSVWGDYLNSKYSEPVEKNWHNDPPPIRTKEGDSVWHIPAVQESLITVKDKIPLKGLSQEPMGWVCPRCGKVWAPHVQQCMGPKCYQPRVGEAA